MGAIHCASASYRIPSGSSESGWSTVLIGAAEDPVPGKVRNSAGEYDLAVDGFLPTHPCEGLR